MATLAAGLDALSLASSAPSGSNAKGNRSTNRFSALASLAAEQDTEVEDELARGQPASTPSLAFSPPASARCSLCASGDAL